MRHVLPCLFVLLAACGDESPPKPTAGPSHFLQVSRPVMGTQARVALYSREAEGAFEAAQAALDEIERLEKVLSDYDPESELMKLCAADNAEPTPVSRDLYEALTLAMDLARRTGGAFDPTVGPFTHLWRRARESGTLPEPKALIEAKARVGWQHVELHPPTRSVRLRVKGMQLDFGGFGKGFAAQAAWAVLGSKGFTRCLVDVGGDIVLGAPPEGEAGWAVHVPGGDVLLLHDCAVASSGDSERSVEIDGVRYGHIVDPQTGLGITTGAASVVVAQDAVQADVFATVLCVVSPELGIAQAAGTDGVEARLTLRGAEPRATPGFGALLKP